MTRFKQNVKNPTCFSYKKNGSQYNILSTREAVWHHGVIMILEIFSLRAAHGTYFVTVFLQRVSVPSSAVFCAVNVLLECIVLFFYEFTATSDDMHSCHIPVANSIVLLKCDSTFVSILCKPVKVEIK